LAFALLTGAGVGCSSGDDGDDASPLGPGRSDEPSDAGADPSGDQALADSVVFALDDFPAGWQQEPAREDDATDEETRRAVADCLGVRVTDSKPDHPNAASPKFVGPDDSEVTDDVTVAPSVDEASRLFDVMEGDDVPACYAQAVEGAIAAELAAPGDDTVDVEFGEPSFNPVSFPDMGDESLAFRLSIPLTRQGQSIQVHNDLVLVRVGRTLIYAEFVAAFTPFDTTESTRLTQLLVDRAPTA
jgi:hypothetical protein